ncbi:MAG: GNAT family N-acetyltransferase [Lachnospiraceae bacterium]
MKISIRTWKQSDAASLASTLSNKRIMNNLRDGLPYPYTEKDGLEYINFILGSDPHDTFAYAIDVDGVAVGSIGAFRQGNIHFRTAELGYYLAEEYWGKGIMTKAVKLLCEKVFAETDIIRIFAEPFAYNTGSRRVLEKAGFQFEGMMKCNAVKNGQILDMALYGLTRQTKEYRIRRLNEEEIPLALALSWEVFREFVAPEYSEEGVQEFRKSLNDRDRNRKMNFYGAFDGDQLVGTIYMREPQHICGFFVRKEYHRKGIGRSLFETMRRDYDRQEFTVNASPYGVKIYRHLGFRETDTEQTVNGIRFTPMRFQKG